MRHNNVKIIIIYSLNFLFAFAQQQIRKPDGMCWCIKAILLHVALDYRVNYLTIGHHRCVEFLKWLPQLSYLRPEHTMHTLLWLNDTAENPAGTIFQHHLSVILPNQAKPNIYYQCYSLPWPLWTTKFSRYSTKWSSCIWHKNVHLAFQKSSFSIPKRKAVEDVA